MQRDEGVTDVAPIYRGGLIGVVLLDYAPVPASASRRKFSRAAVYLLDSDPKVIAARAHDEPRLVNHDGKARDSNHQ